MATKLDQTKIEITENLMAQGSSRRKLALVLNIDPQTVINWEKQGNNTTRDTIYKRFADAISRGEATHENKLLEELNKAIAEGIKTTKYRETTDAIGNITEKVSEKTSSVQLRAITWQLEHKYGWDQHIKIEKERVINYIIRLAEKVLSSDQFYLLTDEILDSKLADELKLDSTLFK